MFSAISCFASSTTTQSPGGQGGASVLYTFDNTPNDYYGNYNAIPNGSPQYVSPGYDGRGFAIKLNQSRSQTLTISNHMNFYQKSLTVEVWIYPLTISGIANSIINDAYIYAQIQVGATGYFMVMLIRCGRIYGGFFNNDVSGTTMIGILQWQHLAFTYNYTTMTQTVYVDGVLGKLFSKLSNFDKKTKKRQLKYFETDR